MRRKHVIFGLDIGSYSIKGAAVDTVSGDLLEVWHSELIPERESIKQTLNHKEFYSIINSFVKKCQNGFALSSFNVNTAIQGNLTMCRYLEFPSLSQHDLELAVPSQAMKHIASPFESVSYAYAVIPPIVEDKKRTAVFLISAEKELISSLKDVLTKCGAVVQRMEVPSIGMVREFGKNRNEPKDQFYIIVNVGFKHTNIVILRGGYPYFSREFTLAGRDFTHCFQVEKNITWRMAEQYKCAYDTNMRNFMIEPVLLKWMEEVKRSISFFQKQFSSMAVKYKKIFISGGAAKWNNLNKRLEEYLGIPVEIDEWHNIKCLGEKQEHDSSVIYKVAVGLAQEGFNFLSLISEELAGVTQKTKQWWKK